MEQPHTILLSIINSATTERLLMGVQRVDIPFGYSHRLQSPKISEIQDIRAVEAKNLKTVERKPG